jgi:hypothetical protein
MGDDADSRILTQNPCFMRGSLFASVHKLEVGAPKETRLPQGYEHEALFQKHTVLTQLRQC